MSLIDLLPLFAGSLVLGVAKASTFEVILGQCGKLDIAPDDYDRERMKATVALIRLMAESYELFSTLQKCDRTAGIMAREEYPASPELLSSEFRELLERLEDDLRSHLFLHLQKNQAELYVAPMLGWEEVAVKFSKIKYNIEESGKCFALERYGAAVFHVLQVAEYGVIQVAELLAVSGDKPGWGSLKKLSELIKEPYPKRSELAQRYSKLLENVVPLALVIKDSWRHKLDHVDNQLVWLEADFGPQVAEEIVSATRAFMRKLANDFPVTSQLS